MYIIGRSCLCPEFIRRFRAPDIWIFINFHEPASARYNLMLYIIFYDIAGDKSRESKKIYNLNKKLIIFHGWIKKICPFCGAAVGGVLILGEGDDYRILERDSVYTTIPSLEWDYNFPFQTYILNIPLFHHWNGTSPACRRGALAGQAPYAGRAPSSHRGRRVRRRPEENRWFSSGLFSL